MSTEFNPEVVKQQIIDFMTGFTIETTPGSAAKTPDYRVHLRPGTEIAVTFLPGSDFADTVSTSKRLKDEGFVPLPHFAARSIRSQNDFEEYLKTLQGEVGIEHAVALGGAVDKPLGEFESSMQLMETGLFDKYGIKSIGVAGHPEGSPDINEVGLREAIAWKNTFKEQTDAYMYIATQFCFEAEPIIAWDKKIQAEGNKLPIHLGVPGLATLKTLMNHAKACGIGSSMRVLTRQAKNIAKLMTVNAPDKLVMDLARYHAEDPNCGIKKVHMYPLGGMKKSAAWSYAVTDGDFTVDPKGKGFKVNRDIG
ncbi:methylenetetrahydrofolate reductase [Kiloniella sp.]|uniref:methylenetetrahydrofolate reductase n=1 Tax=Kiloniella sp. TaxID=1938587 RepID=UPI003A915DF6